MPKIAKCKYFTIFYDARTLIVVLYFGLSYIRFRNSLSIDSLNIIDKFDFCVFTACSRFESKLGGYFSLR